MCDGSVVSGCFQYSVFVSDSSKFDYHVFWCGSLSFILCGVLCTSWIFIFIHLRLRCLLSHLKSFSLCFFTLLWASFSVLQGWACSEGVYALDGVPWVLQTRITFLQSFLSAPHLHHLHCPVSGSLFFFCLLKSAFESLC